MSGSVVSKVREFRAVVTEIREQSRIGGRQLWQLALDHTDFAEGSKGALEAVARSGARLLVPVLGVEMDGVGDVWHLVEKPLTVGTEVKGCVTSEV